MRQMKSSSRAAAGRAPSGESPVGVTITELAELLRTTVRALRHYEDAGLLQPVRTPGNIRCYASEAQIRAGLIVSLRQAGVSLNRIQRVIADGAGRDALIPVLEDRLTAARGHVTIVEQLLEQVRAGAVARGCH